MYNILEAMDSPPLFAGSFSGPSWSAWRVFLRALYGLPMGEDEAAVFRKYTDRERPPRRRPAEAYCISGRRSGKSYIAALVAVHTALLTDYWKKGLARGERAHVVVVACDKAQAGVLLGYCRGLVRDSSLLRAQLERETKEELHFNNGCSIVVKVANYRSVRGYRVAAVLADEVAFWHNDETMSNPASEVLAALRPAIVPGGMLLAISSSYAPAGVLFDECQANYGRDDSDVLVWRSGTLDMNPKFSREKILAAYKRDPASAAAEYDSAWRDSSAALVAAEDVEDAMVLEGVQRFQHGHRYVAGIDLSGGRNDPAALAVAHSETVVVPGAGPRKVTVVDFVQSWPAPHHPGEVAIQMADVLRGYRLTRCYGDAYGAEWTSQTFRQLGVALSTTPSDPSRVLLELQEKIRAGAVRLPRDEGLLAELRSLLRKPGSAGKDKVVMPRGNGSHADRAVAVSIAVAEAGKSMQGVGVFGYEFPGA